MKRQKRKHLLWLLTQFGVSCLVSISSEELNSDEAGDGRLLVGLFFVGAADFVHQAEDLTYGEFRDLTLEVLTDLGWSRDAASTIFDMAGSLPKWGDKVLEYGEHAMVVGATTFKSFWVDRDETAPLDLARYFVGKWKDADLHLAL